MARTVELLVESRARGVWRVRMAGLAGRLLPRRLALAAARWAVRRVTLDVRSGDGPWRRHHPRLDITAI